MLRECWRTAEGQGDTSMREEDSDRASKQPSVPPPLLALASLYINIILKKQTSLYPHTTAQLPSSLISFTGELLQVLVRTSHLHVRTCTHPSAACKPPDPKTLLKLLSPRSPHLTSWMSNRTETFQILFDLRMVCESLVPSSFPKTFSFDFCDCSFLWLSFYFFSCCFLGSFGRSLLLLCGFRILLRCW